MEADTVKTHQWKNVMIKSAAQIIHILTLKKFILLKYVVLSAFILFQRWCQCNRSLMPMGCLTRVIYLGLIREETDAFKQLQNAVSILPMKMKFYFKVNLFAWGARSYLTRLNIKLCIYIYKTRNLKWTVPSKKLFHIIHTHKMV